ncbi:MAG: hypothetical protein GY769_06935 [bacterium]|nr:hypothetical protein [bacterium]
MRRAILRLFLVILLILVSSVPSRGEEGLLPRWVDESQASSLWIEIPFPGRDESALELTAANRFLIVKLTLTDVHDWGDIAFDLKNMVVEARAQSPEARVALDGSRGTIEQLLQHDLARYVDAYVYRQNPILPTGDPTARLWWRTPATEEEVLDKLLRAGRLGAELVVLEGVTVDPAQRELLDSIQATGPTDLVPQPVVSGIAQSRVHFFLDPESGDHYLAILAPAGETRHLGFSLEEGLEVHELYPEPADYEFSGLGSRSELTTFGGHRFYLFELRSALPQRPQDSVVVDATRIMDPYEIVVMNQAFQKREAQKVESLDVIEVHDYLAQFPRARPGRQEYRVIERRDQATDYIWIGSERNGVRVPEDKLWKGYIYDDKVLLDPLEIELDRTYEYTYLGEESLDGHLTWKVGFEPVESGAYLAGTVWIDQQSHAQRRLRARFVQPQPPLASNRIDVHYQWVEDGGQQYWTWTRLEGAHIWTYLGAHYAVKTEVVRRGHSFNRADLEEDLEPIYLSDTRIIRETLDGDLFWLERTGLSDYFWKIRKEKKARAAELAPAERRRERERRREADADVQTESYGRSLGNPKKYSGVHRAGLLVAFDEDQEEDIYLFPYYSYFNLRLKGTKYQFFFNSSDAGVISFARPGTIRKNWTLSVSMDPHSWDDREIGSSREEKVNINANRWTFSLAMPVNANWSFYTRFIRLPVSYERADHTDPDFVLPEDHNETGYRVEAKYDRRGFSSQLAIEHTNRNSWKPWGYLDESLEENAVDVFLDAGYYTQLTRNQGLTIVASHARGSGHDRFSRIRLNRSPIRAGGYSSQIRFDEGLGLGLDYSGHFRKLFPIRLGLDFALVRPDSDLDEQEHLVGLRLSSFFHGPWKTDVSVSASRGLDTSIEEAKEQDTRFFLVWARRF